MQLSYTAIKHLHVFTVVLTIALFVLRVAWMQWSPRLMQQRWVKIVPHVIDTVLLLSALWLAWTLGRAGTQHWLAAKIFALILYIVLALIALRPEVSPRTRWLAASAAVATFGYIASVAITKSPLGIFARM